METSEFAGPGAVFALLLASIREDYSFAPRGSQAFLTAEKFLNGGTCKHYLCAQCNKPAAGWERYQCDEVGMTSQLGTSCASCGHPLIDHHEYEFDWGAHRDLVIGALGMDGKTLVKMIKNGRRE